MDRPSEAWVDAQFLSRRAGIETRDRRIGRRYPLNRVPIEWTADRRRGLFRKHPATRDGVIVDLSMSGVLMVADTAGDVEKGHTITVDIDGITGSVAVRRITPGSDGRSFYGLEFIGAAGTLLRPVLYRLVDRTEQKVVDG